jgi:flagellar hook-associated protein 3 FlgL
MISGTRYRLSVEINRQTALAGEIADLQAQISTGKRLQAPSDDPAAAAQIAQLARAQANEGAWKSNLDSAAALADRADTALQSVADRLDRAVELVVSARSATLSAENRATIASELNGIADELATLADSPDPRGHPLFRSGTALAIPVHAGGTIAPVASRETVFGNVATAAGTSDIIAIVRGAASAATEPDATRETDLSAAIDAVNAAAAHIAAARGNQGVTAHRIEQLQEGLAQSGLQLNEQRAGLESTDLVEAIAKLQSRQLSLQAAQSVFAHVNQSTLFDLLR